MTGTPLYILEVGKVGRNFLRQGSQLPADYNGSLADRGSIWTRQMESKTYAVGVIATLQ